MKKAEMAEFKKLLQHLQSRLRGDLRQLADEALGVNRQETGGESKSPTHMAELGSETFEQDFAMSLVQNEQETLELIAKALVKIDAGIYGQCEGCLKEGKSATQAIIPKERLRVIPYATYCVRCARVLEGSSP